MNPIVKELQNRAMIFEKLEEREENYNIVYNAAKKIFNTRRDLTSLQLRLEFNIPYDLSLRLIEDLRIEKINKQGI